MKALNIHNCVIGTELNYLFREGSFPREQIDTLSNETVLTSCNVVDVFVEIFKSLLLY